MSDNILQKSLAVTYEDFLKGVFGERPKPEWFALLTLFSEIEAGQSTLVSDLSEPLRRDCSAADRKRVQERVSGWLMKYDFVAATGGWLLKNIPADGLDGLTFAVDFSDISKVFGGAGMEGMAMGRDGSTGDIRMGRDFVCVSLVGAACREALPVYVKLGRGRGDHDELLKEAIEAVMGQTGGRGWVVLGAVEPAADGHLRGAGGAGLLRPLADRDFVLRDEAGVRAGEGSREEVQAPREPLRALRPGLRLLHAVPPQGEGVQEDTEVPLGQPRGGLDEDSRAPRGHPRPSEGGSHPLHHRASAQAPEGGRQTADACRVLRGAGGGIVHSVAPPF